MRRARWLALVVAVGLIVLIVMWGGGGDGPSTPSSAPSAEPSATAAPSTTASSTTTASPTTGQPPATDPAPTDPVTVAESGGWRLVVSGPRGGQVVPPGLTVCYEATGAAREPVLALDVSFVEPGGSQVTRSRVDIAVGRGSVGVQLPPTTRGPHDLVVALVVDGTILAGASVLVPGVLVSPGAAAVDCR